MHGARNSYSFFFLSLFLFFAFMRVALSDNPPNTIIYTAKKVITMDRIQPEATAIAVQMGRIYSVGSLDEVKMGLKNGSYTINNTFANDIIIPGFIEAHAHLTMLAIFLSHPYIGYWDFPGLNGSVLPAQKTKAAVLNHLKEADKKLTNPNEVLFAWGFDPIYFNNTDLTATDLDQVSKTRPIFVLNASEHIAYVNSVLLKRVGYNAQTNIPGVIKGKDNEPTGVLKEMQAAGPVIMSIFKELFSLDSFKSGLYGLGDTAHRLGLTTFSDLLFGGPGEPTMVEVLKQAANDPAFPLRMVIVYNGVLLTMLDKQSQGQGMTHLNELIQQNSNKLRFGQLKWVSDGSIQGYTARLEWPGYFDGAPNGIFNTTTQALQQAVLPYWKAGYPIHVHVNGNQATESALDTLDYLQNTAPRRAPLFVLEHDQMTTPEQLKRTHDLGAYINFFANHIYYWGDQHYAILLGPNRANRLDPANEAERLGIIYSLHTDSPVTPLGPLHSMWAAMNRVTASGRMLGAGQRLSAENALRAVTLNAAYLLNLQNEVGSIEVGKRADFTVLARDPLMEPAMTVKDIPIIATIQDGVVYPINGVS